MAELYLSIAIINLLRMSQSKPEKPLPAFVSHQVAEARRFFLNLTPDRRAPLAVVCGGVERVRPDYVVDRREFAYFAVELVAEGEGELEISGQRHVLSPGSVFAYGQQTAHRIVNRAGTGMRKYYVDFVGTRAGRLLQNAGLRSSGKRYNVQTIAALHELTDVFDLLIRNGSEGGPSVHAVCCTLMELLLLKLQQRRILHSQTLPQSYATYEAIRRCIDERFLELHSARDVAAACHVTPVYLSRLFGRFADCGAYQYLLRRRMNYAAGLLMNEGLLVKEVAFRLGYPDAFQFSRAFKRIYGIPPSQLPSVID